MLGPIREDQEVGVAEMPRCDREDRSESRVRRGGVSLCGEHAGEGPARKPCEGLVASELGGALVGDERGMVMGGGEVVVCERGGRRGQRGRDVFEGEG